MSEAVFSNPSAENTITSLVLMHPGRDISGLMHDLGQVSQHTLIVFDDRLGPANIHDDRSFAQRVDVVEHPLNSFAEQRNIGIKNALGNWVLSVDSDERLSADLINLLQSKVFTPEVDAYAIARTEFFRSRKLTNSHPYGEKHIRLFRSNLRYNLETPVHEELLVDPDKVQNITEPILHLSEDSAWARIVKSYEYGRVAGANVQGTISLPRTIAAAPSIYLRQGFWRDGRVGASAALVHGAFRVGRYAASRQNQATINQ